VLTGLTILFFVIFHIAHFTLGWVDRVRVVDMGETISYAELKDPIWKDPLDTTKTRHDTYRMFVDGFRNVPIVALYIICQLLLGMHLIHGVNSSFQSLGLNSRKFNAILHALGYGITAIVVAGNVIMPLAVLFRFIGTDIS
jgi:succinate dehydrogenase / fumarate reductase cytochrome b subunit